MKTVTSKDGTTIAFEKVGTGPTVLLVNGAMGYRQLWGEEPLSAELSKAFTVYMYDRRGRGESTDTQPYAVEREIEDIEAIIDEAGGSLYLYGTSSGAALALKAASNLGTKKVAKLALYEPPYNSGDEAKEDFARYTEQMDTLLEANKRDDAVAFFLADMMPPEMLKDMRQSPVWPLMEAVAPTLAYDSMVMGDGCMPTDTAKSATMPTLILDGDASQNFFQKATNDLAMAMPHAQRRTLKGQAHQAESEVLAPVLVEFFTH